MWNQEVFVKNILALVDRHSEGNQRAFNAKIKHRDAVSKWKSGKRPNFEIFLRVLKEFRCSADWLLTGKDDIAHESPASVPKDISDDLAYIFKNGDIRSIQAITMDVKEFRKSMERDKKVEEVEARLSKVEEALTTNPPGKPTEDMEEKQSITRKKKVAM